jgi:alkylation response protein AidB-like acyl-CoA dehydrogenase
LIRDIFAGKRLGNALAEVGGKKKAVHSTRVVRRADGKLILNGEKIFATGSYLAEWVSVSASSDNGPIGVLVNRNTPGLELLDDWRAFGQHNSVSGSIRFNDIEVDERFVPRREGAGGLPGRTGLTWPQILHAAIDTGIARGALNAATHYLRNHARPWVDADVERAADEHHVIKTIGEYAVAVRSAEALLRYAADTFDQHKANPDDKALQDELILAVASARAQSDRASISVSSDMFSLLGASSSLTKWNLDRFWRNARVHTTHDPIRWRLHHVGNYYLNGIDPSEYGAALWRQRERAPGLAAADRKTA